MVHGSQTHIAQAIILQSDMVDDAVAPKLPSGAGSNGYRNSDSRGNARGMRRRWAPPGVESGGGRLPWEPEGPTAGPRRDGSARRGGARPALAADSDSLSGRRAARGGGWRTERGPAAAAGAHLQCRVGAQRVGRQPGGDGAGGGADGRWAGRRGAGGNVDRGGTRHGGGHRPSDGRGEGARDTRGLDRQRCPAGSSSGAPAGAAQPQLQCAQVHRPWIRRDHRVPARTRASGVCGSRHRPGLQSGRGAGSPWAGWWCGSRRWSACTSGTGARDLQPPRGPDGGTVAGGDSGRVGHTLSFSAGATARGAVRRTRDGWAAGPGARRRWTGGALQCTSPRRNTGAGPTGGWGTAGGWSRIAGAMRSGWTPTGENAPSGGTEAIGAPCPGGAARPGAAINEPT
jgi:hypothetical protein